MLCCLGKLLYFQGSRFSLVFLWHFPEQSHGACFSCLWHHCGVVLLQRLLPCPDPGRRSKVREHGDGKQPRGLFSLLIILLSRGRCGVSLKEQREMRPVILMLHCLFCNHYYLFSLYNTRDSSYLFVLRENHMIQRKELCFRGPGL